MGLDVPSYRGRRKVIKEYDVSLPTPGAKPNAFTQQAAVPSATAPRPGVPLPGSGNSSTGKIVLANTLEGVEQSTPLVVGQWPAYVEYVEETEARTGAQGIQFHLRFLNFPGVATENPNDGRKGKHTVYVTPKAMWKVKNTFCAVGQCDAVMEFDAKAAEMVLVVVEVANDTFTPNPTEMNPNPKEITTAKCDTIREWPEHLGGPGTKYQGA